MHLAQVLDVSDHGFVSNLFLVVELKLGLDVQGVGSQLVQIRGSGVELELNVLKYGISEVVDPSPVSGVVAGARSVVCGDLEQDVQVHQVNHVLIDELVGAGRSEGW